MPAGRPTRDDDVGDRVEGVRRRGGGLVLLVVWPVLAALVPAIRLTMDSPVLFRQQRAGRHGATFELLKFRTMRTA
jgi:lipopolysaccharide/colanic/teichoic acid biosynthesis glycosyltransferase